MNRFRCALPAVALCAYALTGPATTAPAEQSAPEGTRHIYISALDKKGAPVMDLTDKEISIREDGTERPIVGVQRATAPLTIALLVDDSGPGLRFIRVGVGSFIQRLGGLAEIAL